MKICYKEKRFTKSSMAIITVANAILEEYDEQGFVLTLRQLYYQFVARDLIANKQSEYNRLGSIINDARLAGLIDWDHLIDRTRNLRNLEHFDDASDALHKLAGWYHVDFWDNQNFRPEVWIEKDALVGVIEGVCQEYDVPFFSCRGYTSQSEMWGASQRLLNHIDNGQTPYIFHLGDHDPSGIDMSRDIKDRLSLFIERDADPDMFEFERIALNMDQIKRYNPPPNPAKITDSRSDGYITKYGTSSWELDALEPATIVKLIKDHVWSLVDVDYWEETKVAKAGVKKSLKKLAGEFAE